MKKTMSGALIQPGSTSEVGGSIGENRRDRQKNEKLIYFFTGSETRFVSVLVKSSGLPIFEPYNWGSIWNFRCVISPLGDEFIAAIMASIRTW